MHIYIYFLLQGSPWIYIYIYVCTYVCISPGGGNGNPLQHSCLGNPTDRRLADYSPCGCKELDMTDRLTPSLLFHAPFPCGSPQDIEYNSLCSTVESGCWATKYIAMVVVQLLGHVWLLRPLDCSPPGSSVPGILQGRTLQWVTISFSILCRVVWTTLFLKLK